MYQFENLTNIWVKVTVDLFYTESNTQELVSCLNFYEQQKVLLERHDQLWPKRA